VGLFLQVAADQFAHVFWLLRDEEADFHPVGGHEFEITPEGWEALDDDVRDEIARHLLPGSDVAATPQGGDEAPVGTGPDATSTPSEETGERGAGPSRPPRTGRGSGREEQERYARTLGIDTSGLTRTEIISKIDQAEQAERMEE
jgi:hypothetical protein